jgi:hypothetical protein
MHSANSDDSTDDTTIAGAGKTFLTSVVIDDPQKLRQTHDGIAYLYCGYQDRISQKPLDFFSAFTKQLLEQLPEIPNEIVELFDEEETQRLDMVSLKRILLSMPTIFSDHRCSRAFIVCDALDEMDEYEQRQVLLPFFHDMAKAGFKIFLTSRPYPADVRESFSDAIQLDITPNNDDLEAHIKNQLIASPSFVKIVQASPSVKLEDVVSSLASSAKGM